MTWSCEIVINKRKTWSRFDISKLKGLNPNQVPK
jgi:hypothetical protein